MHPEAVAHVHHMIMYECPEDVLPFLEEREDLSGGPCGRDDPLLYCGGGRLVAGWAVGGGVSTKPLL